MRPVPGYSSYGVDDAGTIWRTIWPTKMAGRAPLAMKSHASGRYGYRTIKLVDDLGYQRHLTVHRLVALAHLGPRPDGMQVRHLDGDNQNNHPSNLAYGTAQENIDDRGRHRGHAAGDRNGSARISWTDVHSIRRQRAEGRSYCAIADDLGLSRSHVRSICLGRSWKGASE